MVAADQQGIERAVPNDVAAHKRYKKRQGIIVSDAAAYIRLCHIALTQHARADVCGSNAHTGWPRGRAAANEPGLGCAVWMACSVLMATRVWCCSERYTTQRAAAARGGFEGQLDTPSVWFGCSDGMAWQCRRARMWR